MRKSSTQITMIARTKMQTILQMIKKEHLLFIMLFFGMSIYYLIHLFTMTPWYDELYTYYSFISRGPIYAAIHWPVPNNHVLYSTLSAFLDWLGNPFIGLRGISYICALLNLTLLYTFANKFFHHYLSVICVCLYCSITLVNTLAIQGRGYTFTITCYLIAIHMLSNICVEPNGKALGFLTRKYQLLVFALSLTGGLYAIPSSLYWVLPTCFVGGFYLLLHRRIKELFHLILTSLLAALLTLFFYSVIWLAIGANLVSKDTDSLYYGVYQLTIIAKAPLLSLQTGIDYMLATPYIQSISPSQLFHRLFGWLDLLFHQFYAGLGQVITITLCISIPVLCVRLLRIPPMVPSRDSQKHSFFFLYLLVTLTMFPLILIIQSVLPYQRVFIHLGIVISLLFTYYLSILMHKKKSLQLVFAILVLIGTSIHLLSPSQNISYGLEEEQIYEAFSQIDIASMDTIFYTDDYQKYVLKFYWDLELKEAPLEEADCILIHKTILEQQELEVPQWPILYTYGTLPIAQLESYYPNILETDSHLLYYH